MRIVLNGEPAELRATVLDAALEELGYGGATVATAVNESFVPATARAATRLAEGDRLEIVAPRQGG
ncbi:MAG: sulfur carrier protein ThiS [Pseudomonadota bacterium]